MLAHKHTDEFQTVASAQVSPMPTALFSRSMLLLSVLALIGIVSIGANSQVFSPPLLALSLFIAFTALVVSVWRQAPLGDEAGNSTNAVLRLDADSLRMLDTSAEILFGATPIATLLVDCERLDIVAANPAAAHFYGCSVDDLCARRVTSLQHPVGGALQATPAAPSAVTLTPVSGLARHRRTDGSAVWVDLDVQRIDHSGRAVWLIVVTDVSARLQLARELEVSEQHFKDLTELSLGIVFIHDLGGKLKMVNPAFSRSLGYTEDELIGHDLAEFVAPRQHDAFAEYLLNVGRSPRDSGAVHMLKRDSGERVWEFRNQLRSGADGSQQVLCCAIDTSERSRNERRLLETSRKDPLTGCYNRRHLAAFQADAEVGSRWACIVVDIDHLKRYNDAQGHRAGDQAIVRTAQFLERLVRKDDSVVRLGGDEFVILLRHCDKATLESFAVRLQRVLANQETIPFSFGLAMREDNEELEQTIHRADRQMIERRLIERSSIRLDTPCRPARSESMRPRLRIMAVPSSINPAK